MPVETLVLWPGPEAPPDGVELPGHGAAADLYDRHSDVGGAPGSGGIVRGLAEVAFWWMFRHLQSTLKETSEGLDRKASLCRCFSTSQTVRPKHKVHVDAPNAENWELIVNQ